MPAITTRKHLDEAPALAPVSDSDTGVTRAVTLARCLRCGFEWLPRVAVPSTCARCRSVLWNVPRAQKLPGKPAPTRQGKPRGRSFNSESGRRAALDQKKDAHETPGGDL